MSRVVPSNAPMNAPRKESDLAAARGRARTGAWWLAALAIGFYVAIVAWNLFRGFAAAGVV
jgi:hypothetical protein